MPMTTAIWWIRRDLRLTDNSALTGALSNAESIVPLFVLDPRLLRSARNTGPRIPWMLEGLRLLEQEIASIGGRLIVREGDPESVVTQVAREIGARSVHFHRDYGPYARRRDEAVSAALAAQGITAKVYKDLVLHEADEIRTKTGTAYTVYTPYRRTWEVLPKAPVLPRPERLTTRSGISSIAIPGPEVYGVTPLKTPIAEPGETRAQAALARFIGERLERYQDRRDMPAVEGTAQISPYLRWGMLSPRQAYWAAHPATSDGALTWISELAWRDFYYQVLDQNPHVVTGAYRPEYDRIRWEEGGDALERWKGGQTGFPIVDAGMRQLAATGWMHNRVRMIVASFLCKDLQIDWREGERYFMQRLLDGDLASNNGGWQWSAGSGTDAAPYFRIFNPTAQGVKFDPHGTYIRRWVPELIRVPNEYIHAPQTMPMALQRHLGCVIGRDYPLPVVDHAQARARTLAMYAVVKGPTG